jgi:cytochrome P450 family 110
MTLPNGPTTLPIVQMMQAIVQPIKTLENNFQKYGDCYTAKISGFGPIVVLTDPNAVEALMTAPVELFESGVTNRAFRPFLGDNSLVLLDGKPHQRQRKLLIPPFHGERLKNYGQAICDITRQVTKQWQPGETLFIRSATQAISLKVIMRTVFGVYEGDKAERLEYHLNQFLEFFDRPLNAAFAFIPALQKNWGPWSPWGALTKQREIINQLLFAEIRERRTNPDLLGEDILSLMLTAKDEEGQSMTDQELRDELMTLLFAGHETTATAIAWAMYWIHRQPEVGQKLRKELDELDENTDPVTIARLPYLSALCDETLRIYPVGLFTFFRVLKSPWTLMGQKFEAGTQFSPCIYLLHHRPDLYPDPDQFRPERFLERQFSLYEYIPFGGGNRRCLGMAFALFEMKLVLATILSQWKLQLTSDRPIHPIRRGFTIAPEKGVPMRVLEKRRA